MLHPIFCRSVRLVLASPSKLNYSNPFLSCALKPQIARDHEVPDTAAHLLILVGRVFVQRKGLLAECVQGNRTAGQHRKYCALKASY